jgi:hypothetical protein
VSLNSVTTASPSNSSSSMSLLSTSHFLDESQCVVNLTGPFSSVVNDWSSSTSHCRPPPLLPHRAQRICRGPLVLKQTPPVHQIVLFATGDLAAMAIHAR